LEFSHRICKKEKDMNRPSWKSLVFGVVIVTALFAVVDQANAWCGGCGVPLYGPFPAYTAWDSCCGGNLYLGCRPGPVRRLVFGPYRWYGGWYGSYGCGYPAYSCYTPCYSSCYPTYSSCCGGTTTFQGGTLTIQGSNATPGQPTPAVPTPAQKPVIDGPNVPAEPGTTPTAPAPALPGMEPSTPGTPTTSVTPDNSGMLTVWVPFDAKVTINGMPTKSTGSRRQFVSYNLQDGMSYKYEVKAEVVRDGKIVEDTKSIVLTAGSNNSVAFGFNIAPAEGLAAAQ
jgi:uncharacterized protein (TIGR03000 family)